MSGPCNCGNRGCERCRAERRAAFGRAARTIVTHTVKPVPPDDAAAKLRAYHATHGRAACAHHAAEVVCPACVERHTAAMAAVGLGGPELLAGADPSYATDRTVEPARVAIVSLPSPGRALDTTGPALPFDREALIASVWEACRGREWVSGVQLDNHFGNYHGSDQAMSDAIVIAMAALIDEGRLVRVAPGRYAPRGER